MKKLLVRIGMWLAVKRPALEPIVQGSGKNGVDVYVVSLFPGDSNWSIWAQKIFNGMVVGVRRSKDAPPEDGFRISLEEAAKLNVRVQHFVGPWIENYFSWETFIFKELLGWPWFAIWRDKTQQYFFNRKRLAKLERYEMLRFIIDTTLHNRDYHFSHVAFAANYESQRMFLHPNVQERLRYYELMLDSLVDTGDLRRDDQRQYRLASKALATIARIEEEERRHSDNKRLQAIVAVLTVGLFVAALCQALGQWWPIWFPPGGAQ